MSVSINFEDKVINFNEETYCWEYEDISNASLYEVKLEILTRKFRYKKPYKHLYLFGLRSSILYTKVHMFKLDEDYYVIGSHNAHPICLDRGEYIILDNIAENLKIVKECVKRNQDIDKLIKKSYDDLYKDCAESVKKLLKLK